MTLENVTNVLDDLLESVPEFPTTKLFEEALQRRRNLVRTIRDTADNYSRELEEVWAKKAWADELRIRGFDVPLGAQKNLESIIADVLSNNCPEGGCHSSVFDEE